MANPTVIELQNLNNKVNETNNKLNSMIAKQNEQIEMMKDQIFIGHALVAGVAFVSGFFMWHLFKSNFFGFKVK